MLVPQARRLSIAGIGQLLGRGGGADVAGRDSHFEVESGNTIIRASMEEIWEIIKQPGLYTRNPFVRIDQLESLKTDRVSIETAEKTYSADQETGQSEKCRANCKLRDNTYLRCRARKEELAKLRASAENQASTNDEENELDQRMKDTHKAHKQWGIVHHSPKGRKLRWGAGGSATTYHTLSSNDDGTCTYWIVEDIRFPVEGTDIPPTPALWEQSTRKLAEQIKKLCERGQEEERSANMSEKSKGKQRADVL